MIVLFRSKDKYAVARHPQAFDFLGYVLAILGIHVWWFRLKMRNQLSLKEYQNMIIADFITTRMVLLDSLKWSIP